MSSAEVTLGAKLYLDAVEEGLPSLFKDGGETTKPEDYRTLQLAFRDMSRQLVRNKAVVRDADGNWQMNDDAISKMDEATELKFLPYYETVVMAHQKANAALIAEGRKSYVDTFRELHQETIFEIEPETVTRIRGADMQNIVSASLSLLEATREDPANAAFVKGLDRASLDTLWSVLEQSNYLMPGENPDREAPIGEQVLRGTPEEQEAAFHAAAAIAANLDLPEVINAGDKPATRAALLRSSVVQAQTEEVELDGLTNSSPDAFFDSDLTKADANSLFNLWTAGTRLVHKAQWDTESLGNLLVDDALVEDVRIALADYEDKGIENALDSGNFEAPGIDADTAKRIAKGISWLKEAVETDVESLSYTGDDGGALTQEGATMAEGSDFDNAFDRDEDEDGEKDETVFVSGQEDMAAEKYGKSDRFTRINESMVSEWDRISLEMLGNGVVENLRRHAGRAEIDMEEMTGTQAAFGSLEDAMGANRVVTGPELTNRVSDAMSKAAYLNINPERRAKMRVYEVTEGRGIFEGFKEGGPEVAEKRVRKFLNSKMLDEKGRPNLAMRNEMHKITGLPVYAKQVGTARGVRDFAHAFVERDREEFRLRSEAGREKRGITSFDLDADKVARFIDVVEASGSQDPARVMMGKDGIATVSHPEAPKLSARMSDIPKEVLNADKSPRVFGGHLSIEQLRAAYQTGADKMTVLMDGERPYGVIGKVEEQVQTRKATRKFEDLVLS